MKKILIFILCAAISSCSGLTVAEPTATITPTMTATALPTPTPTITPAPSPTEEIDLDSWNSVSDGKIVWRQRDLLIYDNQYFVPNPETAGKLYDKLLSFVCAINYHSYAIKYYGNRMVRNYTGAFTEYINTYIKPRMVRNDLIILVPHPKTLRDHRIWNVSATTQASEKIDLTKFSIAIAEEETVTPENGFIKMWGYTAFKMQPIEYKDGIFILQFVFSRENQFPEPAYELLGLSKNLTTEENLLSLIQVMNVVADEGARLLTSDSELVMKGTFTDFPDVVIFSQVGSLVNPKAYFRNKTKGLQYLLIR